MKKIFMAILVLLLAVAVSGCLSGDEHYAGAMRLITGEEWSPESGQEQPQDDIPAVQPPQAPEVPQYAEWPEELPKPITGEAELTRYVSGETFHAGYILSTAEYERWLTALGTSGFVPEGDLWLREGYAVAATAAPINETQWVYCDIQYFPHATVVWPLEFAVFPQFSGAGSFTLFETGDQADGSHYLHAISQGESRDAVAAYIQLLQSDGFIDQGYGSYGKNINGVQYQFLTEGIWMDDTTAELYWYIIR